MTDPCFCQKGDTPMTAVPSRGTFVVTDGVAVPARMLARADTDPRRYLAEEIKPYQPPTRAELFGCTHPADEPCFPRSRPRD